MSWRPGDLRGGRRALGLYDLRQHLSLSEPRFPQLLKEDSIPKVLWGCMARTKCLSFHPSCWQILTEHILCARHYCRCFILLSELLF